jgi:PPM family protein phosphatase
MTHLGPNVAAGQLLGSRERQEDALGMLELPSKTPATVLVVADGMGGHAAGDVAAQTAVEAFLAHMRAHATAPADAMDPALHAANGMIRSAAQANPELKGLGCTLVSALIQGNRLRWISVGDSALFLVHGGTVTRLNADHSMRSVLADLVAAGRMKKEDADRDPSRSALRSAVSGDEIELIDHPRQGRTLARGDVLLLASDGMEALSDDEVANLAAEGLPDGAQGIADRLLAAVEAKGLRHQDNTTVVAYVHGDPARAGRPAKRRAGLLVLLAAILATSLAIGWIALVSLRGGALPWTSSPRTATQKPAPPSAKRNISNPHTAKDIHAAPKP